MVAVTQRSFAGGELLDALHARGDLDRYGVSLRVCENMVPTRHGLLVKRPGMRYRDDATYTNAGVRRFVPFVFSDDQSYVVVIECGTDALGANAWAHPYFRGARITQAAPAAWDGGTEYIRGQYVTSGGIVYQALHTTTGDAPAESAYEWQAYPYCRVPVVFSTSQLTRMQRDQSGDVLTLVAGFYIQQIRRLAHNRWDSFGPDGTAGFLSINPSEYSVENLAVVVGQSDTDQWHVARSWEWEVRIVYRYSANEWVEQSTGVVTTATAARAPDVKACTLGWDAPAGIAAADHYYRIYCGRNGVRGLIGEAEGVTGGASASFEDDGKEPIRVDGGTEPLDDVSLPLTGYKGPGALAYFEGRRVFAGSSDYPTGLWASNNNTYRRFMQQSFGEGLATDGISVRLGARGFEEIRALVGSRRLLAFTSAAEWHIGPPPGVGLTRFNTSMRAVTHHGSGYLPPLVIGDAILFVDKSGNTVRELRFVGEGDGHETRELSLLARHLLDGHTIVDWTFQEAPEPIVWMVRDDGVLLSLTYSPTTETVAWARHTTAGTVENVCCIPEGTTDVLYLCVLRTLIVNDTPTQVRTIESMVLTTSIADSRTAQHLDCATWGWDGRPGEHPLWPQALTTTINESVVEFIDDFTGATSDWAAGDRLVLEYPTAAAWIPIKVYAVDDLVTYQGTTYKALLENAGSVPAQSTSEWMSVTATPDLVLTVSSVTDAKVTCSLVTGTASDYLTIACAYEVQKTHIHDVDRFEGEFPANGLSSGPTWYADGAHNPLVSAVVFGVATMLDPARAVLIGLGLEFSARVELLDVPTPGKELGTAKKLTRTVAWDVKTCGVPAMGASLESLTNEEIPSATSWPYARSVRHALPATGYVDEALGAMQQTSAHPLQVYKAVREVEFGGT